MTEIAVSALNAEFQRSKYDLRGLQLSLSELVVSAVAFTRSNRRAIPASNY